VLLYLLVNLLSSSKHCVCYELHLQHVLTLSSSLSSSKLIHDGKDQLTGVSKDDRDQILQKCYNFVNDRLVNDLQNAHLILMNNAITYPPPKKKLQLPLHAVFEVHILPNCDGCISVGNDQAQYSA
jgi:hypothetical protein